MSNESESDEQWVTRAEPLTYLETQAESFQVRRRIRDPRPQYAHHYFDVGGWFASPSLAWADARRRLEPKPDAEAKGHPEDCQCPSCWDDARKATAAQVLANSRRGRRDHPDTVAAQPKPDAAGEALTSVADAEVWIAEYIAGPNSGTLSRGLRFRSIHPTEEEARYYLAHCKAPVPVVTRYLSAPRNPDLAAEAKESERELLQEREARIKAEAERDEARNISKGLARAVQNFRGLWMLGKMTRLRATPEYGALCRAWEATVYETDSWVEMRTRAEAAEAELSALRTNQPKEQQ